MVILIRDKIVEKHDMLMLLPGLSLRQTNSAEWRLAEYRRRDVGVIHPAILSTEVIVLARYGLGMSYKAIPGHLKKMYDLEVSTGTLSAVIAKIIHTVKEWQARPMELIYLLSGLMPSITRSVKTVK